MPEGMEELAALPYLGGQNDLEEAAVLNYDAEIAHHGFNLLVSAHLPEVSLLDMKGNARHTWTANKWPGDPLHGTYIRRAHMLPTGELLALFDGLGIVKLDKDSTQIWKYDGKAHHDLDVGADGTIYTLVRDGDEDLVATLSADGTETARVSIADCLTASEFKSAGPSSGKATGASAIEVLDGSSLGDKGQVLVSLAATDSVVVLDLAKKTAVWGKTGTWKGPQESTSVTGGGLLVFDAKWSDNGSRVVETDASGNETWAWEHSEFTPLWSASAGSCQRLGNGNILIVETEAGRAVEVTRDRDVAWEYHSPFKSAIEVAALCDMVRLDEATVLAAFPELKVEGGEIDLEGLDGLMDNDKK